jgi:hypothetical protein
MKESHDGPLDKVKLEMNASNPFPRYLVSIRKGWMGTVYFSFGKRAIFPKGKEIARNLYLKISSFSERSKIIHSSFWAKRVNPALVSAGNFLKQQVEAAAVGSG